MENEVLEFRVDLTQEGERLDKIIPLFYPALTRSQGQQLIENEHVWVNEKVAKASYKVQADDIISLFLEEPDSSELLPENIPLDIRYEDNDVLVINKPQGMVVHPAVGHYKGTLVNALLFHFQQLSSLNGPTRPGIVHRIDKDTSGLLLVAKNDEAHRFLAAQIKSKQARRIYLALVHGVVPAQEGIIKAPIGRHPTLRKEMGVVFGGKEATTHFKVLERFENATLLECELETGRTHQIRVHLNHIGYPIFGDPIYSRKTIPGLKGQLLHALQLHFMVPSTQSMITIEAPIPDDFLNLLNKLRVSGTWEG